MSIILPSYIAVKSTWFNKYLIYTVNDDRNCKYLVKFTGNDVFSPLAKFEVIRATTGPGLVHIKCIYNKKFLQARKADNGHTYLVADADEQEEDQLNLSCTLFEPLREDGDLNRVRLKHVRQGHYTWALNLTVGGTSTYENCLAVGASGLNHQGIYSVIDLESLVVLPKHVAFKSHDEDIYPSVELDEDGRKYLKYESSTIIGQPKTWFEVKTNKDGRVQIMSYDSKKFWSYDSYNNWIVVELDDSNNKNTLFLPLKIEKNVIALRCLGNNNFCSQKDKWINAAFSSVTSRAHLKVVELVQSRQIYNVVFRFKEAITYDHTRITMATTQTANDTEKENNVTFRLSYTNTKSSTWSSSLSLSTGVSAIATLGVPLIDDRGVVNDPVSSQFTGTYEWGSTLSSEKTLETTYTAVVPPRHKTTVNLMATNAYCNVPFSYYIRDILLDGQIISYKKDDGLYTGVNYYNYRFDTKTISL